MFDLNDVEPMHSGEPIPDGTFAKVTMTIRPGGIDGFTEIDRGLLKPSNSPGSDVLSLECEFTVVEGKVQLYMAYMQLPIALFTATNRDSLALYHEIVPFDAAEAQALSDKAVAVIRAAEVGELMPRIAVTLKRPDGTFFYVGKAGALRFGETVSDSMAAPDDFKRRLLDETEG